MIGAGMLPETFTDRKTEQWKDTAPRSSRLCLRAARWRLLGTLFAILLFAGAASGQATDLKKLFQEAYAAQRRGDADQAVSQYQKLLRQRPDMTPAHANLGVVFASLGRYDEAITQFHIALAEAPADPSLRMDLGLAYYKKQDFAGAAAQFALLHKNDPSDTRVATVLGNCEVHLGLDAEAVALLKPIEKVQPDNAAIDWALGSALIHLGHTREGLERIQRFAEQGKSAQAYAVAAYFYLGLSYFDKAKSDAVAALRLDPKLIKAHVVLGIVEDYSGDEKDAEQEFHKALDLDPRNLQARIQLASVLYNQRKLAEAQEQISHALTLAPNSPVVLYVVARIKRAEGNLKAAVSDLQAAERQQPEWLPPHIELVALYYQLKRPREGAREKKIVDQLRAAERQGDIKTRVVLPRVPLR
jgi:tetratricopeptide (TPR) repeat protein